MLVTILLFIIIFTIIVVSHELGHFLLAKVNGIKVNEFFVGMGPTLIKYQGKETLYSLKLFPVGGACVFEGEDGLEKKEGEASEGSFQAAGVWARISCVIAGPLFNFILAFLFSVIIVSACGVRKPVVGEVMEGYGAQLAGIQAGDVITVINGKNIHLFQEVSLYASIGEGDSMEVEFERNGEKQTVVLHPTYSEEDARYYIGIISNGEVDSCKGLELFQYAAYEVQYWIRATFESLGMLLTGDASVNDMSGPVGIAQTVGETYEEVKPYGFVNVVLNMMNYVVLLSVNLGIINLLPLPALDGGRLLFMVIELVRGKPVSPDKEGMVHLIGMAALVALMVFVMYNDIMRLIR